MTRRLALVVFVLFLLAPHPATGAESSTLRVTFVNHATQKSTLAEQTVLTAASAVVIRDE